MRDLKIDQATGLIDALSTKYTILLSELIHFESVYGNEKKIQLYIEQKLLELGIKSVKIKSRNDDDSINIAAVLNGKEPDKYKSLILNAHVDIAPIDDGLRWTKPSLSGIVENNIIYGRGAQDDKAGVAILLLLAEVIQALSIELYGDLIFQFVVDDETTGAGSKALIDAGFVADGVIICDGTWSERIVYAHLGQIWLDVFVSGDPVAACVSSRGVNPVFIAMEYIDILKKEFDDLNNGAYHFEGIDKPFVFNVGSFHSGVWHGSVPSKAELKIQISFPPPFTPDKIFDMACSIALSLSNRIFVEKGLLLTQAYATNRDAELIKKLSVIVEKNTQKECLIVPVTGHCDMRHFPTKNICLYGPGGGKNAHGINEYYMLEQMPVVAKNILDFINDWCNESR